MGCASSTPMIQNSGSEMLKAATHVATDATKTAEDTIEGIKDSVGKSVETAKDSVTSTVESVKHEVENVVKEKSEMLEDAKNSLMEKLHLKQAVTESEINNENSENAVNAETDELETQLNAKSNTDVNDAQASSKSEHIEATKEIREQIVTGIDNETDSLKTCTPEPEIEQAFAKSQNNHEDENDNPPTPKPTLAELEQLTAEVLKEQQLQQQQQQKINTSLVNDTTNMSNDPVISAKHENIKTHDSSNNMMSLTADNNTIRDHESNTITTTTSLANNDFEANVHNTPKNSTAVHTNHFQAVTPLTNAVATTTNAANQLNAVKDNKGKQKKSKINLKEETVARKAEEKRPKTTEWEKFADMLSQIRKFNPHDAFRRGSTHTKFGGGGVGQVKERSFLGHQTRDGIEDDGNESISNSRESPQNSQRSSALGRSSRLPNRPNTGNNRRNPNELVTINNGGYYANKTRRSSNFSSTGRKFDYNPIRSRVNEFVSSSPFIQSSFFQNTVDTQMPYAPYITSYEGSKSPPNMRSHHSRSDMITLPPLEWQERLRARSQPSQNHQHFDNFTTAAAAVDHNGNSMPQSIDFYNNEMPIFIRQSSNTSLSSNSYEGDNLNSIKSSSHLDVRLQTKKPPSVKNTSSFLTTPRSSPFGLTKSYTDLYFSTPSNKEKQTKYGSDKSSFRKRKNFNVCLKKHSIK